MGLISSFTKYPDPVFVATQDWEGENIEDGCIVFDNGIYYRFYAAGDGRADIGYATASPVNFPYTWTKYAGNPIIYAEACYSGAGIAIAAPRVIKILDGSWRMYVHSFDGSHDRGFLFTATAEGFPNTWSLANSGNPILSEGGINDWDGYQIQTQVVVPEWDSNDDRWHLFYLGYDAQVFKGGHATSEDGISWTKDANNPVTAPDGVGWDSTHLFPVGQYVKIEDTFYIPADGFGAPTCAACTDGSNPTGELWRVGFFQTTDLNSIGTPLSSPVLSPGCDSTWDQCGNEGCELYQSPDGTIYCIYLGISAVYNPSGGSSYLGGLAINTSFIPVVAEIKTANAIGSINKLSADYTRYITAEVKAANAFGSINKLVASARDASLSVFNYQIQGPGGVVYPFYIKTA